MSNFFTVLPQYLVPQIAYTRLMGWLANLRWPWLKKWMVTTFIRRYNVDMKAAIIENPDDYATFNQFFTRYLKPELRPIAQGEKQIASPVDGCVSQIGIIQQQSIIQAKQFNYSALSLLGGDATLAEEFTNGAFTTLYLSPRDYHRIHMPLDGTLRKTIYVPGKLFSVNQITAATVPNLFARNERLVCIFDTAIGPMAVILIGAMIVGNMGTVWGENPRGKSIAVKLPTATTRLSKGAELGHFKLGSTVILLFAENRMAWTEELHPGSAVMMGQEIGEIEPR